MRFTRAIQSLTVKFLNTTKNGDLHSLLSFAHSAEKKKLNRLF